LIVVYRHINLDSNKVFYVGIGTEKRAYDYKSRSKDWKAEADSSSIETDIIFKCDTREQAYQKEIEFINFYGRVDKKTGTLVNKTDGGGWLKGVIWSPERVKKYSDNAKEGANLPKYIKEYGSPNKGKTLGKRAQHIVDKASESLKESWTVRDPEIKKKQTALFINNNPSHKVQECKHCGRSIQGASAFRRFHGENCKNKNNLKLE
jgi:hypothetical protein